uniref:Uncharacterized protein n=1 Tax=Physcomitrium patens TaxID=3218 RepID=A0A2K1ICC4_PHYPA|nr:hypothetical protein PHYPA_030400 [Physcomitrium patens]
MLWFGTLVGRRLREAQLLLMPALKIHYAYFHWSAISPTANRYCHIEYREIFARNTKSFVEEPPRLRSLWNHDCCLHAFLWKATQLNGLSHDDLISRLAAFCRLAWVYRVQKSSQDIDLKRAGDLI